LQKVHGRWNFYKKNGFLNENATLRTNENFRNRSNEEHHKATSPFEILPIDMINAFPLDYMHLICLGVTKLLITLWLKVIPGFSTVQTQLFSDSFIAISKFVPKDFNRKPQSLLELQYWKATNFRFFLLYAGPIILKGFLPNDFILHFNHLSCAIRILCHPTDYSRNNSYARDLLLYFVRNFNILYGKQFVTSNVHLAGTHLAADAERIGPLDSFSAFDYENNMKFMKKLLRKNEKPLQQIHRRLSEHHKPSNKRSKNQNQNLTLKMKLKNSLPFQCKNSHKKLLLKNFELTNQQPDNCCILENGTIVVIEHIGKKDEEIVIIAKKFSKLESIKHYPLDSTEMGIGEIKDLSCSDVFLAEKIVNKAFLFTHNDKQFVVPLLH
jgi:hypothetical protein